MKAAEQLLRQNKLQVTAQRMAVLKTVTARPHATADVVADDVRSIIGTISRQAVYDTLGLLVERNLLRRIQPAGSPARYEARVGDNHHHLICRACGLTFDINCAVGARPCLTADDDHGFDIDEAEVIYWGRCSSCRATALAEPVADQPSTNVSSTRPASKTHAKVAKSVRSTPQAGAAQTVSSNATKKSHVSPSPQRRTRSSNERQRSI